MRRQRECGIWDAEHSPQHDSYVTRDLAIKEEYFVFFNPYDDEDTGKLPKWNGHRARIQPRPWSGLDRANAEHGRPVAA
jgi:hypothetical protein